MVETNVVNVNATTSATVYGRFDVDTPDDFDDDDDGTGLFDPCCCCCHAVLGPVECCYAIVTCCQVVLGCHTDCECCEYCHWCLQDIWNGCI